MCMAGNINIIIIIWESTCVLLCTHIYIAKTTTAGSMPFDIIIIIILYR